MIPVIVVLFYLPYHWSDMASGLLFAVVGITDAFDGYFARKLGQVSPLGAFLDPVADKLIVATALVLIVSKDPAWYVTLTAAVIIGREIAISALREWMAEIGAHHKMQVSGLAKFKTIVQIVGPVDDAVPRGPVWPADLPDRARADGAGGRPDPLVDDHLPRSRPGRNCAATGKLDTPGCLPKMSRSATRTRGNSSVGRAQPCQG